MIVQLPTKSDFLRGTFPRTRYTLEGRWQKVHRTSSAPVEIFSGSSIATIQPSTNESLPTTAHGVLEVGALRRVEQFAPSDDLAQIERRAASDVPRKRFPAVVRHVLNAALTLIISMSVVTGAALFAPRIYYTFFPADTEMIRAPEDGTPFGGSFSRDSAREDAQVTENGEDINPIEQAAYIPPLDTTLPEGAWLVIPRIGVRTELQRTADAEEALKTGVWHVPDFGEPGDTEKPVILAAHRFGWKWWWQNDYWKYHSFYLLPDTQPGDRVEILYDQRKWVYEIYAGEEGTEITDYDADVILYTCKFLDSPLRHVRYARLINPETDTQATGLEMQLASDQE